MKGRVQTGIIVMLMLLASAGINVAIHSCGKAEATYMPVLKWQTPKKEHNKDGEMYCLSDPTHMMCEDPMTKCTHFYVDTGHSWLWYRTVCKDGTVIYP